MVQGGNELNGGAAMLILCSVWCHEENATTPSEWSWDWLCVCVMKDDAQTAQTLIFYLQDFTSCRRNPFNLQACRVDTEYTESTKQNINDFLDLRLSRLSTAWIWSGACNVKIWALGANVQANWMPKSISLMHIDIWVWVNTYRYIFSGMNIHLPAILGFTRYQGFDPSPYDMCKVL